MSLPTVLLVDDSEAVLAYERAALTGTYAISTASNGVEALEKLPKLRPDAVVLDLSMPGLDGEDVLKAMRKDPALADVPVVIVSAEVERADACRKIGASAVLHKPIRAPQLLATLASVIEKASRKEILEGLAAIVVAVGDQRLALPLECVESIFLQPATRQLPIAPFYMDEVLELGDESVCVLDLALRLGLEHAVPRRDRKIVVISVDNVRLGLCVDDVRDPEEFAKTALVPAKELGGSQHEPLKHVLLALARTAEGAVAVINPRALLTTKAAHDLSRLAALG